MYNSLSLNLRGRLVSLRRPLVMGIINATPDSFFAQSRAEEEAAVKQRAEFLLVQGADIIDVGACSTRPGAEPCDEADETARLRQALAWIRSVAPNAPLSVDTFRADVARMAVEEFGVAIVNDVTGGQADARMFRTVAQTAAAYVLTHSDTLRSVTPRDVLQSLVRRAERLHAMGVCDVILDPGIGFTASRNDDFALLRQLSDFREAGLPLLIGLSRKRLVWETLETRPADSLFGTIALNMFALTQGANILRVHDVEAAVQTVKLFCKVMSCD